MNDLLGAAESKCPECGKTTLVQYRPFCSKRCADIDLGHWFNGEYVLPGDTEINDDFSDEAGN
ncbi:DNA gyrase inhibitor YacG [Kordiimonas sp. SCSIO 12610]|uniref:DNA gyrase inhibitor YacG n=1 Tax=Kordiimonas sp. SCSIO 12610 TaxID=2829597 RepID=UPI00210D1C95|nr:DNA gyrase inhibitor YacG [Kordiimonas sp. SCSIO 12610]UTW55692.1 DNA gyrase inhibitor YacG [Kordiimonas sp. SCSIO 12610]